MQQLVEYLIETIVDEPEAVQVTPVEHDGMTVYQVEVTQSDLGKVIGRHGRTADALRTVVGAAAQKRNMRATVDIIS